MKQTAGIWGIDDGSLIQIVDKNHIFTIPQKSSNHGNAI